MDPSVAINCAALVETLLEAELFGKLVATAVESGGFRGESEAAPGGFSNGP